MRSRYLALCFSFCFCSFLVSSVFATPAVDQFKQSWVARALALQREIDLHAPLNQATFIGTHNSENAVSYQIPFVRYVDPNQLLSIYDQLEMGARSVEFDVHWYMNLHFQYDILLCHGLDNHVGCSMFDRSVTEGLEELRSWLARNPNEVVLLYFDRGTALDGHESLLAAYVQAYLGDYVYRPVALRSPLETRKTCVSLPGSLTKAAILLAGKQVLIITKGCDSDSLPDEQSVNAPAWNDYVFAGMGQLSQHPFTFLDSTIGDDFTAYPDCSTATTFSDDKEHTTLWRIFEDRTVLSNGMHANRHVLAADVRTMVRCGINWQTLDMLRPDDDRLAAAIWSWAPDYPRAGQGNCAFYQTDVGIQNTFCAAVLPGFACQNAVTQTWQVAASAGAWQNGEASCQQMGYVWHFAMPVNGKQLYWLSEALQQANVTSVWVNYAINQAGHWYAND